MPDPHEVEIIRRCQRGEEPAFRELLERYQRRVCGVAFQILNDYAYAQDVAQEAFLRVFRHLGSFDLQRNFYTWLYQIVVNLCIDRLRKLSHGRPVGLEEVGSAADDRSDPAREVDRAEVRQRVRTLVDRLPLPYKTVLVLRDIEGFSCREIGEIIGCSDATTRWRLHHARRLFRDLWTRSRVEALLDEEREALP